MRKTIRCLLWWVSLSCAAFSHSAPALFSSLDSDRSHRIFTIQGSNTIGAVLAPNLLKAWFAQHGLIDIAINSTSAENEHIVSARIPNTQTVVEVLIGAHGSGTGYQHLLQGTADIAASSRAVKQSEVERFLPFTDLRSKHSEHILAIDGLAIVVHPTNPIAALTIEQLSDIFSGAITNWREVGGQEGSIRLHARDHHSGTWDSFKSMVLENSALHDSARRYESNAQLERAVILDPNAIGFIGLAAVSKSKVLGVIDGQGDALWPTSLTVATEDYALSRRLYLYTQAKVNPWVRDFLIFAQSEAGQQVVTQADFIAQQVEEVVAEVPQDLSDDVKTLLNGAKRLTLNFRFDQGSARLDNKAHKDVERLVNYLQQHPTKQIILVGLGDPKRVENRALLLSKLRAMSVRRELIRFGIYPAAVVGLGDEVLVADSSDQSGRIKNRRVEVWVRSSEDFAQSL